MYICNTEVFGYIPNQVAYSSIEEAAQTFIDFKVDTLGEISITQMFFIVNTMTYNSSLFLPTPTPAVNHPPVFTSQFISPPDTPKDNLGLDAVSKPLIIIIIKAVKDDIIIST